MRYLNTISIALITFALALVGCVGFEPVELESKAGDHFYRPSDYKGLVLKDQVFIDFREGLDGWWADKKYNMSLQGTKMKITSNGAGPKYAPFGIDLAETVSFENTPVIRLKIRLPEGEKAPVLRMDLRDGNGKFTNAAPAAVKLKESGEEYYEYFFDINNKWKQTYPTNADVDNKTIDRLQFFVNPGGEEYYGVFFIDEIYVMANKDGSGIVDKNIIIDDFTSGGSVDLWWPCKPEKVSITATDSAMKVHFDDAQWDCFGKVFGETDITENPIIRIKARAVSNTPVKFTNTMARFIDADENSTDLIDQENMMEFEVGGSESKYYYSAFRTKYEDNLFSSKGDFDAERVNRVIIFFNMNKETNFTGDVFIEEVAFVQDLPQEIKVLKSPWGPIPSMEPSWKKASDKSDYSYLTKSSNWSANNGLKVESGSAGGVKLIANNSGPKWESAQAKFDGFNFYGKNVLKVTAKVTGSTKPEVRIDCVDDKGIVNNGRPVELTFDNSGEWKDYYFNQILNYYQRSPELKTLNYQNIKGFNLYLNGGSSTPFTGEVEIKSIVPVSMDDVPEKDRKSFE